MKKKWFWILFALGLIVKLGIAPFTESHYSRDFFVPFLDASIVGFGQNPWTLQPPENFPYGSILWAFLVWPKALGYYFLGPIALGSGYVGSLLFKLPILLIDTLLFLSLCRRYLTEPTRLLAFYWLNPIVIYINYYLGHLDIVSMAFITFSCFSIYRGRVLLSGVLAGCAIASKFHTALAVPLILLYIWRNEFWPVSFKRLALWIAAASLTTFIGLYLPFKAGHIGYVTLTSPEAMRLFAFAIPLGDGNYLYAGFVFVLAILGRLMITQKLTDQGLFFGFGILFNALLLATNPMSNWYLWMMPFTAVFATQFPLVHWGLPFLQTLTYFLYFVGCDPSKNPNPFFFSGLCLTLFQTTIAANLGLMWYFIVKREFPLSSRLKPVIIGIAGDSGAGKSRLSEALSQVFDVRKSSFVEGDDYHKWERGNQNFKRFTHLSPQANFLSRLSHHTQDLSSGRSVLQPHYDHSTGLFTPPRTYRPSQTIIIQGLHTLYSKLMRESMDLKVFINPHPTVRMAWKINRDKFERSYSIEKILSALEARRPDGKNFIEPQMLFADWIIEALPADEVTEEDVISGAIPKVKIRHVLWNDAPIEALYEALSYIETLDIRFESIAGDIDRVSFEVAGEITANEVSKIAAKVFPMLKSLTRAQFIPKWQNGFDGVNQLIALSLLDKNSIRSGQ